MARANPTTIDSFNPSSNDGSGDLAFSRNIDGSTFSLWDERNILGGSVFFREKLYWYFTALNGDGS